MHNENKRLNDGMNKLLLIQHKFSKYVTYSNGTKITSSKFSLYSNINEITQILQQALDNKISYESYIMFEEEVR